MPPWYSPNESLNRRRDRKKKKKKKKQELYTKCRLLRAIISSGLVAWKRSQQGITKKYPPKNKTRQAYLDAVVYENRNFSWLLFDAFRAALKSMVTNLRGYFRAVIKPDHVTNQSQTIKK